MLAGLLCCTGCGGVVVGSWTMERCIPNHDTFCFDNATFARDGTYAADLTVEGKSTRQTGAYKFNGFQLTLQPSGGGQRRYNATVKMGRLKIMNGKSRVLLRKDR